MPQRKYATEEERRAAILAAKRKWARAHKDRLRINYLKWKAKREIEKQRRNQYTTQELIEHIAEIKEDFSKMSQRQVADKWGRHRRSLVRLVEKYG